MQGRMYLTEGFVCFAATMLGIETKVTLSIVEIKELQKHKFLGVFESGIGIVSTEATHYFCSFDERDDVYEKIDSLWQAQSPYAKQPTLDSGNKKFEVSQ